jgi:glycosyltransferase involved in cell wall biosynthesis
MKFTFISNIFAPHVRGGYELGCETIARRLVQLGHDVTVLTSQVAGVLDKTAWPIGLNVRRIFEPVFEYEEHLNRVFSRSVPWHRHLNNAFGGVLPANAIALANYFEEHQTDVVWIFNPLGLGPVGITEVVANQKAKCLIHFMDHIDDTIIASQRYQNYSARWRRNKQRLTAISCSAKIRNSNEKLGSYRQHHVVFNGFSPAEIPSSGVDTRNGKFRFLYFGQLSREKGLPQVIQSFATLVRRQPKLNCQLDIVGKGAQAFETELREQIKKENIANRIRWIGFTPKEKLLSILREYDAAIMLLNHTEPFAYSPLEAASAGLPVILTASTGNAEAFPKDYPLLVANRDDTEAVTKKLEWCVARRQEMRPLAGKLWQHLAAHCDFDSVTMPAYLKAIEECPQNIARPDLRPLLAANATVEFYSQLY